MAFLTGGTIDAGAAASANSANVQVNPDGTYTYFVSYGSAADDMAAMHKTMYVPEQSVYVPQASKYLGGPPLTFSSALAGPKGWTAADDLATWE